MVSSQRGCSHDKALDVFFSTKMTEITDFIESKASLRLMVLFRNGANFKPPQSPFTGGYGGFPTEEMRHRHEFRHRILHYAAQLREIVKDYPKNL